MFKNPEQELNLGNSGTGMRLMLGLISGLGLRSTMIGDSSLKKRPMNRVIEPLKMMGAKLCSEKGNAPISTLAQKLLMNFEYKMPIASAQVKSSLLLAAMASKINLKLSSNQK